MILSDVTKLKTSELAGELKKLLLSSGKSRMDWDRVRELINEIERRAFEAERLSEAING